MSAELSHTLSNFNLMLDEILRGEELHIVTSKLCYKGHA